MRIEKAEKKMHDILFKIYRYVFLNPLLTYFDFEFRSMIVKRYCGQKNSLRLSCIIYPITQLPSPKMSQPEQFSSTKQADETHTRSQLYMLENIRSCKECDLIIFKLIFHPLLKFNDAKRLSSSASRFQGQFKCEMKLPKV